jgi:FtsZ-binding cell division protein ZapB
MDGAERAGMSASQQKRNKDLHKRIEQLEARTQQAVDEANYFRRGFNSSQKEIEALREERNEFQQSAVDALGKVEDLQDEVKRLREIIPQAWRAGMECVADSGPCLDQWMKQKGLA